MILNMLQPPIASTPPPPHRFLGTEACRPPTPTLPKPSHSIYNGTGKQSMLTCQRVIIMRTHDHSQYQTLSIRQVEVFMQGYTLSLVPSSDVPHRLHKNMQSMCVNGGVEGTPLPHHSYCRPCMVGSRGQVSLGKIVAVFLHCKRQFHCLMSVSGCMFGLWSTVFWAVYRIYVYYRVRLCHTNIQKTYVLSMNNTLDLSLTPWINNNRE